MKHSKWKKYRYLLGILLGAVIFMVSIALNESLRHSRGAEEKHRLQWWLSALNWDEKRSGETGKGIRIAVLDSGVDETHSDIRKNMEEEYRVSGLTGEREQKKFHGTAVAGIIAGTPATEKGILGVAPNAKIISIDVTDHPAGIFEIDNLVEGIEYAIEQNVDVINISAGVKQDSKELRRAVLQAYHAGIVIVAASGNYMEDSLLYPAMYSQVIAAGAIGKNEEIINYFNKCTTNITDIKKCIRLK